MKKVKATNQSRSLNVAISELRRVAMPGEEFEVTDARFLELSGNNRFKAVFVTLVEDLQPVQKKTKKATTEVNE